MYDDDSAVDTDKNQNLSVDVQKGSTWKMYGNAVSTWKMYGNAVLHGVAAFAVQQFLQQMCVRIYNDHGETVGHKSWGKRSQWLNTELGEDAIPNFKKNWKSLDKTNIVQDTASDEILYSGVKSFIEKIIPKDVGPATLPGMLSQVVLHVKSLTMSIPGYYRCKIVSQLVTKIIFEHINHSNVTTSKWVSEFKRGTFNMLSHIENENAYGNMCRLSERKL